MAEQAIKDRTAVVGIGTTEFTRASGRTVVDLATEASLRAIGDAGLVPEMIDGVVTHFWDPDTVPPRDVIQALGVKQCNYQVYNALGGTWACSAVATAAMAVHAGMATHVLVYRAFNGRSGRPPRRRTAAGADQWMVPFGVAHAAARFGPLVTAYMEHFGVSNRDLGHVAVMHRSHALVNTKAMMGKPLTIEEHQESRWIAYPFRALDCCLRTDGAAAVIVTSVDRARDLRWSPVLVMAVMGGSLSTQYGTLGTSHVWQTNGVHAAPALFTGAGIAAQDVDLAELYDPFTGMCLLHMEDFGLAPEGGSVATIKAGDADLDGSMPVNTHGGLLSEAYTNGLGHVIEAVQQLRMGGVVDDLCEGEHDFDRSRCRQVREAEIALVCSECGDSSLILRRG